MSILPVARHAIGAAFLVSIAVACGGGERASSRQPGPAVAGSTVLDCDTTAAGAVVNVAVAEYIRLARPTPQRFLSSVGPGTTPLPEAGVRALQDRGPTYFYPADTAGQAKVRARLAEVGAYASLLVLFDGVRIAGGGDEASVRLGGRYVGGEQDGIVAPMRAIRLRCEGATWKVTAAGEERTA